MATKKNRSISICEFESILAEQHIDGAYITKKDIEELRNYIDEQNSKKSTGQSSIHEFLKPIRNGVQANNYVGILQTKSGLTIEILPKIYAKTREFVDKQVVRELFLKMLKTVRKVDGKNFALTNLDARRGDLLEVFISMFLKESDLIIKRGLKATYVEVQENEKILKGKLLMTKHLRKNCVNQTRFYTEFNEFLSNAPENILIKTTLEFLLFKSGDNNNLRIIREQLVYFDLVDITNVPEDMYKKIQPGRNYRYYDQALEWCRIFLNGKTFTPFKGTSIAFAILFPMEKIFESYIAELARKSLPDYHVSAQDKVHSLFDKTEKTNKAYRLKPDIVVRHEEEKAIIADTKWKVLDGHGPSQSDFYQMYAYYTRYHHMQEDIERVILIYPYAEGYSEKEFISLGFHPDKIGAKVQVRFVDLLAEDIEEQIRNLFVE